MTKAKRNTLLCCIFLSIAGLSNGQNVIKNASFEKPRAASPSVPPSESWIALPPTAVGMPNWTVTSSSHIDWHHKAHGSMGVPSGAGGGNYHIDVNADGCVQQSGIVLSPSTSYQFSYSTSIHSGFAGTNGNAGAVIEILDPSLSSVIGSAFLKNSSDVGVWKRTYVGFTTPSTISGTYTVRLCGQGAGPYANGGVLFDSLVLQPVYWAKAAEESSGQTSILSEKAIDQFKVFAFPNPASQNLSLSVNAINKGSAQIIITDMVGKVMINTKHEVSIGDNTIGLDIQNLNNGIYNLSVVMDNTKVQERLTINK